MIAEANELLNALLRIQKQQLFSQQQATTTPYLPAVGINVRYNFKVVDQRIAHMFYYRNRMMMMYRIVAATMRKPLHNAESVRYVLHVYKCT